MDAVDVSKKKKKEGKFQEGNVKELVMAKPVPDYNQTPCCDDTIAGTLNTGKTYHDGIFQLPRTVRKSTELSKSQSNYHAAVTNRQECSSVPEKRVTDGVLSNKSFVLHNIYSDFHHVSSTCLNLPPQIHFLCFLDNAHGGKH